MWVGIKLDCGFSELEEYRDLYRDRDILHYLRELGFKTVETALKPPVDDEAIWQHARQCIEAGLSLSVHPYTEGTESNPSYFSSHRDNACRQMHEKFFLLAGEISRLQQSPCVMNLHSAAAPADIPRRELVEQSVRFFEWAKEWCAEHAPGVQLMAELQYRQEPHESLWRIGDEYEELLEVVERSGVGACWDFGHAAMNAKRYGLGLYPPESLLEKFEHVHCHDVNGEDHQPLVFGGAPWKQYLQQLAESGFEGTIILEIPPQNFLKHDGIIDLEFSAKALRQHVSECLAARSK